MRISLNWLRDYIDIDDSPERLAELLTMQGLEVENIERQEDRYANFVVGQVVDVAMHPQADKLTVCQVNAGTAQYQIVCGAPNVARNQNVIVGLVGAVVPHDQHSPKGEPFTLSRVKLRGVESFGMICSAYELGLGDDRNGIMVLDEKAKPGEKLADYLGLNDVLFDVGITPNRPDAMCHVGIAREIGAFSARKLRVPQLKLRESKSGISRDISIEVASTHDCPRYTARIVRGVDIRESPAWLKRRLEAIDIRPINNVVDITNYVLMEIGQPLHAFDYDKLQGKTIKVRHAGVGVKFTTLDGKSHDLNDDALMICDSIRPVAIAGVMGGENSEISESTTTILLESAYFLPQSVRKTSKALGIVTDASQRFERGTDPNVTEWAIDRAASLIQSFAGGEILKGRIDIYPHPIKPKRVSLSLNKSNKLLGTTLSKQKILSLLSKIDIKAKSRQVKSDRLEKVNFEIPTFRPDLEREIDLVEEVARLYGYDNIETKTRSNLSFSSHAPGKNFSDDLRNYLTAAGFNEVIANSMQEISIASLASPDFVQIANPISRDMAAMRTSLVPGMVEIIRNNIFHGTENLRLFEMGKVYRKSSLHPEHSVIPGYLEEDCLLIALSGHSDPVTWSQKPRHADIFDLKGEIETLFKKIFLDKYEFIPYSTPTNTLTEHGLVVEINGESAGFLGIVSGNILSRFKVDAQVLVAELKVGLLDHTRGRLNRYSELPKYPAVLRDLAIVVDDFVHVDKIVADIRLVGSPLLKTVTLFDIYAGEQIERTQKSCAFALEFQSEEQTLAQQEIDRLMQKIIRSLEAKFNARLRT
jgi:phenylalanyl-tRNA synthetase beta chain